MLNFISFGSGSSGNCYYLYTEKDGLLIDTGVGLRILKKHFHDFGLKPAQVNYVLVTHDHADHVKSVGSFSCDFNVPVYASRKVHNGIASNYCVRRKIDNENIRVIQEGDTFQLGDFTITSFPVPHDSSDNLGFKIVCEGISFCLMTDAGHVSDEMKTFIGEADYLVIEANHDEEMLRVGPYPQYLKDRILGPIGHLSNKDCAAAIAENATPKLKHVWLCHLSEENNHPELARKTVEMVLQSYGLLPGKDFLLDVLKRKMPSGVFELK
jgi:phosphoribosyl 1,2-cyclic phosphodiesterase